MRTALLAGLAAIAAIAAVAPAAPARADDFVATLTRDTPIAAYGGVVAWSQHDAATRLYRLTLRYPGGEILTPSIAGAARPFDVSVGPDVRGRTVALYTRCRRDTGASRCDVYRYSIAERREALVRSVSSPRFDEAWPVQWHDRLAFVRRYDARCDVPFVRELSGRAASRRLDRGSCGRTTGMSIHGERIVQVTFGEPPTATRYESQVRLLSVRGGAVRVLLRQGSGEESNVFSSPSQSAQSVWLTRTGVHPSPAFVHLRLRSGRRQEALAHANLTGSLARDDVTGAIYYVEGGQFRGDTCTESAPVPCRLVRTTAEPVSATTQRTLLPTLTLAGTLPNGAGGPYVLAGRLYRSVVDAWRVRRLEPLAGVPIELLRRVPDATQPGLAPESFEPTGIVVTTGLDGRWSYTFTSLPERPVFSAVTRAPAVAPTYTYRSTLGQIPAAPVPE